MDDDTRPVAGGTIQAPDKDRETLPPGRYLFTAAQNNTYVHEGFLASLLHFCKAHDARLMVARFTYNKNAFQNLNKEDHVRGNDTSLWYDSRLDEFFFDQSAVVAPDLIWCGELNILPTAVTPLSGLDNYTRNASGIVPHVKVALQSIPTMKYSPPKFMYTTGAITQRNYIPQKAGQKAAFHHVFGALLVEVDTNGEWFARHIVADSSGSFYDIINVCHKYTPHGVMVGVQSSVAAVNWGDIHAEHIDPEVENGAFFGADSMLRLLRPDVQFVHDLTDFRARNHHNINDPYFLARMAVNKTDSVEQDMRTSAAFVYDLSAYSPVVVVESNHDQALLRWLASPLGRTDPQNARYWHELNVYVHRSIEQGITPHVFEHAVWKAHDPWAIHPIRFLHEDESYTIADRDGPGTGIECGMHGHRGTNGARGNPLSLRGIGNRVNIGHTHSACIRDGVYVAGVSAKLDLGYNVGPSSWSHSHIITYKNGKRCIVTMRGSKWRGQ